MRKFLKYTVAVIGAALVFVGVFFVWGAFINPLLPGIFQAYIHVGDFGTNNWLGVILGLIAAVSSFRATLKMQGARKGDVTLIALAPCLPVNKNASVDQFQSPR